MPKPYVAYVYRFGSLKELHFFDLPSFGEKDFYRATTSATWFNHRENNRVFADNSFAKMNACPIYAALKPISIYQSGTIHENVTEHTHASLWDTYAAIGYDYKKRRYANPEHRRFAKPAVKPTAAAADKSEDKV